MEERKFNFAGPCNLEFHYTLPPMRHIPTFWELVEQQAYFVIHGPHQTGKTTAVRTLAEELNATGRYVVLLTNWAVAHSHPDDLEESVTTILDVLNQDAEQTLPPDLRPPAPDATKPPRTRLRDLLVRWSGSCDLPVVLLLDEVDALSDDALISVLAQIRSGHPHRPDGFPQSVVLCGSRDVSKINFQAEDSAGQIRFLPPFNIVTESFLLPNFSASEVADLVSQHTEETGQPFSDEAVATIWRITGGLPPLVNALAQESIDRVVDRSRMIDASPVRSAANELKRRNLDLLELGVEATSFRWAS